MSTDEPEIAWRKYYRTIGIPVSGRLTCERCHAFFCAIRLQGTTLCTTCRLLRDKGPRVDISPVYSLSGYGIDTYSGNQDVKFTGRRVMTPTGQDTVYLSMEQAEKAANTANDEAKEMEQRRFGPSKYGPLRHQVTPVVLFLSGDRCSLASLTDVTLDTTQ